METTKSAEPTLSPPKKQKLEWFTSSRFIVVLMFIVIITMGYYIVINLISAPVRGNKQAYINKNSYNVAMLEDLFGIWKGDWDDKFDLQFRIYRIGSDIMLDYDWKEYVDAQFSHVKNVYCSVISSNEIKCGNINIISIDRYNGVSFIRSKDNLTRYSKTKR